LLVSANRVSALLDTSAIVRLAVKEAHDLVGTDVVSIALMEGDTLVMQAGHGVRGVRFLDLSIPRGAGLGGRVLELGEPVCVADYSRDPGITRDYVDVVVREEGIGGITGAPIMYDGELLGVLYGAVRSKGQIGDRSHALLVEYAGILDSRLAAARDAARRQLLRLHEERQRTAFELHDTVGQLLFGIGVAARNARGRMRSGDERELERDLVTIEAEASRAASSLRDALRSLRSPPPEQALAVALQTAARAFEDRCGVHVHYIVIGEAAALPQRVEDSVRAVVREALHNVEKHAEATLVLLTLCYEEHACEVVVQDDGVGLAQDVDLDALRPAHGGLGLESLARRVDSCGGTAAVIRNDDGGTTVRVRLPRA
jgi:signal transduction histidine kinase